MTSVDDAARELYAEAPSEFVAARNARAATARREGDRESATAIAALPKPSAGAWILNALARTAEDELRAITELGERYRAAERDADRAALVALNSERRSLLGGTVLRARETAEEAGHPLNARAVEEVEQTLRAAIADENAAVALLSGILVAGMRANGIDPVDVSSAVAGSVGALPKRPSGSGPARKVSAADRKRDAERQAEERRAAEQAAAERRSAERAAAKARKAWERTVAERDSLAESLASLQEEVARGSDQLADAETKEQAARAEWHDAEL
jgi:hypothetical protein